MSSSLPDGFRVRPASLDDATVVNDLVITVDTAVQGWSDSTEEELLEWWRLADLAQDSWMVEDGTLAAYAVLFPHPDSADIDGFVHPDKTGQGLGSWLLRTGEQRVRDRGLTTARTWCLGPDAEARALFERFGYAEVRRYYRMQIELDASTPPPEWPDGFRVSTFEPDDARAFHATLDEAFAEEWNFVSMPFEQWVKHRVEAPDHDPTLWFTVRDGNKIAAVLRGDPDRGGAGWIGAVGVLQPWRKRGVGLALLQHAFAEFSRRGKQRVALGVDAQNPTGATRLYERAGMHVAYEAVAFEKELA
ncbi:MAG: mycothiol synthase [Gaiellaceae bacterium]|jgi:mycothiol synthase|nr:mycothiol synthase [Gaiellaceae bacterium]